MNERAVIRVEELRQYIKKNKVTQGRYHVKLQINSDSQRIAFHIELKVREPDFFGSYPQQRISLERHKAGKGHEDVHLQIDYHKIENPLDIGTLYINLAVTDSRELKDLAEGFLYSIYEMFGSLPGEFPKIRDMLFHEDLIEDLKPKKRFFIGIVSDSMNERSIQIERLDGTVKRMGRSDMKRLLDARKELVPILGEQKA